MKTKTVIGGDWGMWTSGHSETGGIWVIFVMMIIATPVVAIITFVKIFTDDEITMRSSY